MAADLGSAATTALLVEASAIGNEGSVVICEVRDVSTLGSADRPPECNNEPFKRQPLTADAQVAHAKDAIAGVYDPVRHHLYVANSEGGRLWSLPEAHALVCQTEAGDWKVLLVPEGGTTLLPPR